MPECPLQYALLIHGISENLILGRLTSFLIVIILSVSSGLILFLQAG